MKAFFWFVKGYFYKHKTRLKIIFLNKSIPLRHFQNIFITFQLDIHFPWFYSLKVVQIIMFFYTWSNIHTSPTHFVVKIMGVPRFFAGGVHPELGLLIFLRSYYYFTWLLRFSLLLYYHQLSSFVKLTFQPYWNSLIT